MRKPLQKVIIASMVLSLAIIAYIINRPIQVTIEGHFDMSSIPQLMFDEGTHTLPVDGFEKVSENEFLVLYVQPATSYFAVQDKRNGYTWYSNQVQPDPLARTESQRQLQRSTLVINYLRRDNTIGTLNNFNFSIDYKREFPEAFDIDLNDTGLVTTYTVVDREPRGYWFPPFISKERFIELVFNPVQQKGSAIDRRQLDQYYAPLEDDPDTFGIRQLRPNEETGLFNMNELSGAQVQTLFRLFYVLGDYGNVRDAEGQKTGEYSLSDVEFDNESYDVFIDTGKPEFIIPLELQLHADHLEVKLDMETASALSNYPIVSIRVLPYFGAIRNIENGQPSEGQLLIPEGSGGLIEFNNNKISPMSYSSFIFGRDILDVPETRPTVDVGAAMPIFGVVQNHNSFLTIIEEGQAHARIRSDVSGKVDSYNKIGSEFIFRQSGSYQLANNRITLWNLTPYDYQPTLRYYFFAEEHSNYSAMAQLYGNYLAYRLDLDYLDIWLRRLAVDILGSYTFDDFFLWVPVQSVDALTTYRETRKILEQLESFGWTRSVVSLNGWFNGGLNHSLPRNIQKDRVLGSSRDRQALIEYIDSQDMRLFYEVNLLRDYDSPWHYTARNHARVIGGSVARFYPYDRATGAILRSEQSYTINTIAAMTETANRLNQYTQRHQLSGLSFQNVGNTLYGDFRRNNEVSRHDVLQGTLNLLSVFETDLMLRNPHSYALGFAEVIVDMPTQTSRLAVVDHAIPFYQLAIAPYLEYFSPSYNMNNQFVQQTYLLHLLGTGSNPKVTLSYQSPGVLAGTSFEDYFDTYFVRQVDYLERLQNEFNALDLENSYLIQHESLLPGIVKVTYSQGQTFVINYTAQRVELNAIQIPPRTFVVWEGE